VRTHSKPPKAAELQTNSALPLPLSGVAAFRNLFPWRWGIDGAREKAAKNRRSRERDLRYACCAVAAFLFRRVAQSWSLTLRLFSSGRALDLRCLFRRQAHSVDAQGRSGLCAREKAAKNRIPTGRDALRVLSGQRVSEL
jgi:hypothetical protein